MMNGELHMALPVTRVRKPKTFLCLGGFWDGEYKTSEEIDNMATETIGDEYYAFNNASGAAGYIRYMKKRGEFIPSSRVYIHQSIFRAASIYQAIK